ncbi:hypothetical protein KDA06_04935 [Candidatus Saccharibacteria bacterium]|jgi:hypothetical protein|nr:hypothetical protein [Candidatus Saccharibacteria bacterium]HPR08966.1 hypothetical protein [Candidatus Saccharibacteria bacterium]
MKTAVYETTTQMPSLAGLEGILHSAVELSAATLSEIRDTLGKIASADICTRQTERCGVLASRIAFELDMRGASPTTIDAEFRL